jgi:hypothetical protein
MLVYDDKEGVWVWTGRVYSVSEQVTKFKDDYADFKTFEEWQHFRNLFLASKNISWKEAFESSVEVSKAADLAWGYVCRGGDKQKIFQALDNLAEALKK